MLKKLSLLLLSVLIFKSSFGQDYKESSMSFALATGLGFRDIKKINGGAYAKNTAGNTAGIGHDFKYKPIYWSAAYAIKRKSSEFGIEFEKQKYTSHTTAQGGVNITYDVKSTLKLVFFNLYYKFVIPYEYKKFTPYVKAGLNTDIYSYDYVSNYTNTFGPPGSTSNSNVGVNFSISLHGGVNYNINNNFSAFTEIGYGPVICKIGGRFSFLKNVMTGQ